MMTGLRIRAERDRNSLLVRAFLDRWSEFAYLVLGIRGLQLQIEFPSDWHEQRRAWVRIGFGLGLLAFSFPWPTVVDDEYQCSGPTYGFTFFGDGLHLHWGKCKGTRDDPIKIVPMPWQWRHRLHEVLTEPQQHSYTYRLRSGELQHRVATVHVERRTWVRPWFPWKRVVRSISVDFDHEVGERTGSWKGGVTGCGYEMRRDETALETLRRMERERKFT